MAEAYIDVQQLGRKPSPQIRRTPSPWPLVESRMYTITPSEIVSLVLEPWTCWSLLTKHLSVFVSWNKNMLNP